jgi:Na+/H+ antiporter NhaD/arsenite permease-like protein
MPVITALVVIFVIAYAAIALEHPLKINKSATALIGAGLLWTIYAIGSGKPTMVGAELGESLMGTAQIVFFLIGAMTIVEVVDAHDGFYVITSRIRTAKLSNLMWMVGFVTFFLSAILDNLTTTIVMVSLMKKLLDKHEDRLFFAGIIMIAANSGGAWSPIGDVTTTMLWIGGQITSVEHHAVGVSGIHGESADTAGHHGPGLARPGRGGPGAHGQHHYLQGHTF